jgi:hypothetical protein
MQLLWLLAIAAVLLTITGYHVHKQREMVARKEKKNNFDGLKTNVSHLSYILKIFYLITTAKRMHIYWNLYFYNQLKMKGYQYIFIETYLLQSIKIGRISIYMMCN